MIISFRFRRLWRACKKPKIAILIKYIKNYRAKCEIWRKIIEKIIFSTFDGGLQDEDGVASNLTGSNPRGWLNVGFRERTLEEPKGAHVSLAGRRRRRSSSVFRSRCFGRVERDFRRRYFIFFFSCRFFFFFNQKSSPNRIGSDLYLRPILYENRCQNPNIFGMKKKHPEFSAEENFLSRFSPPRTWITRAENFKF